MGFRLRRPDHRDSDPRPPAASFEHSEYSWRELPAQRAPQSRADSAAGTAATRVSGCRPEWTRETEPFVMSFSRHRQIYQSDVVSARRRSSFPPRPRSHRLDEFAASYSSAGCTPALPASASPAGSIFDHPAETVNHHLWRVGEFSTGTMRNFQPVLTKQNNLVAAI